MASGFFALPRLPVAANPRLGFPVPLGWIDLHRICKAAHQPDQVGNILLWPIGKYRARHGLARHVDLVGQGFALGSNRCLAHTAVRLARAAFYQTKAFELGNLAAYRRVIASHAVGQVDNADRPKPLDHHQQRKQRAIERDARLAHHDLVALGTIHHTDDIDQRPVQLPQESGIKCIMHY